MEKLFVPLCRVDATGTEKEVLAWVAHRCASVCAAVALFPSFLRLWSERHAAQSASMLSSVAQTMSGTASVNSARKPSNQPSPIQNPSAQFIAAVIRLQTLCMQCVKQHADTVAGDVSAATRASVPWNMVHAVAILGESLLESNCSHVYAGKEKVLHILSSE